MRGRSLITKPLIKLTEFGMGGAAYGNLYSVLPHKEGTDMFDRAWKSGVRYFDTAVLYGDGMSERRFNYLVSHFPRNEMILSSKTGLLKPSSAPKQKSLFHNTPPFEYKYDYTYDGITRSVEDSLQRVGTDYLDILYAHDLGEMTHGENHSEKLKQFFDGGGYKAMYDLRAAGVVRAIGLGVNETKIFFQLMHGVEFDCIMLAGRTTLLDHEHAEEFLSECEKRHVSVICASPFNSGIMSGKKTDRHFNYGTPPTFIETRAQKIEQICQKYHVAMPAVALQFALLHPQVVSVVGGPRSVTEVNLSMSYLQAPIPAALWHELADAKLIADYYKSYLPKLALSQNVQRNLKTGS